MIIGRDMFRRRLLFHVLLIGKKLEDSSHPVMLGLGERHRDLIGQGTSLLGQGQEDVKRVVNQSILLVRQQAVLLSMQ